MAPHSKGQAPGLLTGITQTPSSSVRLEIGDSLLIRAALVHPTSANLE